MSGVSLTNITKNFKIGFAKRQTLLGKASASLSGRESKKEIKVLDGVSLEIMPGEILGLIGNNGSGKSTLLRIIAGIYKADSGGVMVGGKIISLINLGAGLKERLTMVENIFLIASLFGLSRTEIKQNLHEIISFAELEDFTQTKIYQFSQGMVQRLVFAIAVHTGPDILLLDEVFEVGDENFRKKSAEKIKTMALAGVSVILVSHDLELVQKHCARVVWMSHGQIVKQGAPLEVISQYRQAK